MRNDNVQTLLWGALSRCHLFLPTVPHAQPPPRGLISSFSGLARSSPSRAACSTICVPTMGRMDWCWTCPRYRYPPCPHICIGLLISLASTNSFEVRLEYLQPQFLVCRSCERGKQARWRKPSPPGQESRRRGGVLADSGHPMVGTDWHSGRVSSTDLPPDQSYPRPSRRGRGVY